MLHATLTTTTTGIKSKNETLKKFPSISGLCLIVYFSLMFIIPATNSYAQSLPPGFSEVLVAGGISAPAAIAFAPDGRIFVAEKTGALRVIKNGNLLAKPFITLNVASSGEQGLVGITFHPNFASNHYIYLYYTLPNADHNRISRFIASGDTVVPGSETVILNLDPLNGGLIHNAGSMHFGPDGKLYVGTGDATHPFSSQDLDSYHGKILRINGDGTVPPGNPFTTGSSQKKRVWAYGLRNPFTFSFQPGTGRLLINDVGQDTWDEINEATTAGLNFGWPYAEGMDTTGTYTDPVFVYHHGSGQDSGCAVTGGAFFNPTTTNWPASYFGKYFFVDYCNFWMKTLDISGSPAISSPFASNIAAYAVYLTLGPDGNLYYLSYYNDAVYKIVYNTSQAPFITSQPQSISVQIGTSATFSVSATGAQPFTYQWRKNGNYIPGAHNKTYKISSATAADAGNYSVKITNSIGNVISNNAMLTVTQANTLPNAVITSPVSGTNYGGGDVISYSGTGSDAEDGTLPASAFKWYVIFHHDSHTHPGPSAQSNVTSGSFSVPVTGETSSNVYYRLYLVVTDSQGAKDTAYVDILPRTTQITLNTVPPGLIVKLDGLSHVAPYVFTGVEGIIRTISVTSPQLLSGTNWYFDNWSQGSSQTQSFGTPVNNVTYTATFSSSIVAVINPLADAYVRSGIYGDINYGNDLLLNTKNTSNDDNIQKSYLKFDIAGLPGNYSDVKLRLLGNMNNSNTPSATVQLVNSTNNSWTENTITYNNRPVVQTVILDSKTVSGKTPEYYEWDVTTLVNSLISTGAQKVTFMLKNLTVSNYNYVSFNSKENSTAPELRFEGNTAFRKAANSVLKFDDGDGRMAFTLFPNPASDQVTIAFPEVIEHGNIKIMDISGKTVREMTITANESENISVSDLKEGMYFISFSRGDKISYGKIAISR
jgi:glucose/arabinose dehydrogenase